MDIKKWSTRFKRKEDPELFDFLNSLPARERGLFIRTAVSKYFHYQPPATANSQVATVETPQSQEEEHEDVLVSLDEWGD